MSVVIGDDIASGVGCRIPGRCGTRIAREYVRATNAALEVSGAEGHGLPIISFFGSLVKRRLGAAATAAAALYAAAQVTLSLETVQVPATVYEPAEGSIR